MEENMGKNLDDKRNDTTFQIVNFSFISSNIPVPPAYGDYNWQLMLF